MRNKWLTESGYYTSAPRHTSAPQHTSATHPTSTPHHSQDAMDATLSPQKKHSPVAESSRRASGNLTAESTASAAAALGLASQPEHLHPGRASLSAVGGMLITPAKTPQKPPSQKTRENIQKVARSLFSESQTMPSPQRKRGKSVLDSFYDTNEEPIAIYTDSQDRVPEVDTSAENPFYDAKPANTPATGPRRSKRQMINIPGEGMVPLDEAVRRTDGTVIVFRGKKMFQKHGDESGSGSDIPAGRKTRSSIKPRLLFPKTEEAQIQTDEEEVATEIEDNVLMLDAENEPTTPLDLAEQAPGTPEAPKFAPASPPATTRTTRFGKKPTDTPTAAAALPAPKSTTGRGKRSPFDDWRRTKSGTESRAPKRPGDGLASASTKRTRT